MAARGENVETRLSSLLPPTIDPSVAVRAIRKQRGLLLNLIRHCLPTLTNSLLSDYIIPRDLCDRACNDTLGPSERGVALLNGIEDRVEAVPSDFAKVVDILKAESLQAEEIVEGYCTISRAPAIEPVPPFSAITNYRTYLKIVYQRHAVSPRAKWPPTPSKEYISLVLVEGGTRCRDDYIGHTLEGNLKEVVGHRRDILLKEVFEGLHTPGLVLMEGAPGIGKSTLVWELCRKWEECMQQYNLVILLRLREEEVQGIASVSQLFYSYESEDEDKAAVVKELTGAQGKGVLFILDGFDELPITLQRKGFLLNLITGSILPASTVLVTSRPSATGELLASCQPQKHIEILGFTQESVEAYACSVFKSEPAKLEKFKEYISISNPAINSLMYVPLNAAIIVQIYQDHSVSNTSILPHTLTELYTQLCLTVLNRFLRSKGMDTVREFENLPEQLYLQFLKLAELSYLGMRLHRVIFHTVPPGLGHFGFLDEVHALYGGGKVSYNFLHLTIQEFLAAYHISQLRGDGVVVLKQYRFSDMVWRFVAGLTKFKHFQDLFMDVGRFLGRIGDEVIMNPFFIHCLFEARSFDYIASAPPRLTQCIVYHHGGTPLDHHALGYCIANIPTKLPWVVHFQAGNAGYTYFAQPLMLTNKPKNTIHRFKCAVEISVLKCLPLYGVTVLQLELNGCTNINLFDLAKILPNFLHLKEISFKIKYGGQSHPLNAGLLRVIQELSYSTVEKLDISDGYCRLCHWLYSGPYCQVALKSLIAPSSAGRLQELTVGCDRVHDDDSGTLASILSAPSSLLVLRMRNPNLSLFNFENSCLATLHIFYSLWSDSALQSVLKIFNNRTLQHLVLSWFYDNDVATVKAIISALEDNTTLLSVTIVIGTHEYPHTVYSTLKHDSRVILDIDYMC